MCVVVHCQLESAAMTITNSEASEAIHIAVAPACPAFQLCTASLGNGTFTLLQKLFIFRAASKSLGDEIMSTAAELPPAYPLRLLTVPASSLSHAAMQQGKHVDELPKDNYLQLAIHLLASSSILAVQQLAIPVQAVRNTPMFECDVMITVPGVGLELPVILTCQVRSSCHSTANPAFSNSVLAQCKLPIMCMGGAAQELCCLYRSMLQQYQELQDAEVMLSEQTAAMNTTTTSDDKHASPKPIKPQSQRFPHPLGLLRQHVAVWTQCYEPVLHGLDHILSVCCQATSPLAAHDLAAASHWLQYLISQGLREAAVLVVSRMARTNLVAQGQGLPGPFPDELLFAPTGMFIPAVGITTIQPPHNEQQGRSGAHTGHTTTTYTPGRGSAPHRSQAAADVQNDKDWAFFSLSDQNCELLLEALCSGSNSASKVRELELRDSQLVQDLLPDEAIEGISTACDQNDEQNQPQPTGPDGKEVQVSSSNTVPLATAEITPTSTEPAVTSPAKSGRIASLKSALLGCSTSRLSFSRLRSKLATVLPRRCSSARSQVTEKDPEISAAEGQRRRSDETSRLSHSAAEGWQQGKGEPVSESTHNNTADCPTVTINQSYWHKEAQFVAEEFLLSHDHVAAVGKHGSNLSKSVGSAKSSQWQSISKSIMQSSLFSGSASNYHSSCSFKQPSVAAFSKPQANVREV